MITRLAAMFMLQLPVRSESERAAGIEFRRAEGGGGIGGVSLNEQQVG